MSESTVRKQFLDVFLKEWELRGGDEGATRAVERERGDGDFDAPLNTGELRLFAQGDNDLVGLLYKRLDDGWIIVPTSVFTVPATEQEILIGKRVYQLWNSFTASDEFTRQSWLVDTIPVADMKDLCEALLHVMVGDSIRADLLECMGLPITFIEDSRLEYERTFAAGIMFQSIQAEEKERVKIGVLDLPMDFFKRMVAEDAPPRLAAATDSDSSFMLVLDGNSEEDIRKTCVECDLLTTFRSINPDDAPYVYVFKPKSEIKGIRGDILVQARNRDTLEIVGNGVLEVNSGEIVITTTGKVKTSIDKPEQLVLVMAHRVA